MPKANSVSTFLKPLELVHSGDKTRLAPDKVKQIKSVAREVQDITGQVVIFADPTDSENSLAAYYLGKRLNLPVYRVDMSLVISKYIGETEKNLSRLFDKAEKSDMVLMFDEADSLFGKRSEVKSSHDRYANMETNHLLERIKAHHGLVILTSNQRGNLDDYLLRRTVRVIDFPEPGIKKR